MFTRFTVAYCSRSFFLGVSIRVLLSTMALNPFLAREM